MGEEETKTEAPEATENGTTSLSEKPAEAVTHEKEVKEDGVKEMVEDKEADEQAETEKMDEDSDIKDDKETKQEKEAEKVKDAKEEEEREQHQEKEEPKTETVEEENGANKKEGTDEQERSKEDMKEKVSEDEERKTEETKKVKGSSKRVKDKIGEKVRQKKSKIEGKKEPAQRTPVVDRPVRERKSVERLVASIEKDSSRELHIKKGHGTPLKDIPNVAFKLSRRKTDDMFRLLHSILFGRRGKAFQVKSNISRFSGFVWHENEEKQKNKVKDKFDKCNKEKLLEFCDVLDIPISKTTRRKEDIVVSLIDFLVAPHATTTVLLAEKEPNKSKKRKRVAKHSPSTADSTHSKHSAKNRRKTGNASKVENSSADTDDQSEAEEEEEEEGDEEEKEKENGVPGKSEDEMPEQSESEDKNVSEDESEEDVGKHKRNSKASKKESGGKARTKKIAVSTKSSPPPKRTPKKAPSKHFKVDEDSDASPKVFSRKKKREMVTKEKTSPPTKFTPKEKPAKKAVKGKEKAKAETLWPTDEELRDAICEILKEVDFNTATFTDILKQLAQQFDTDLTSRKSSIKLMIQEELTKLADEAEDEDGKGDAEKDETQAGSQEVEA